MKVTIGIVGPIRAGKETVGNILAQQLGEKGFSVVYHRFSDVLRETEGAWHLPVGRDTQQKIVLAMRQYFGNEALSNVLEKRVLSAKEDVVILDGLRWIDSDYPLLRRLPNNYLIYIDAPAEIRWQRTLSNNTQKPDEISATFEYFIERDNMPNEKDIHLFKNKSDFVIHNSSNELDGLISQVKKVLDDINLPY